MDMLTVWGKKAYSQPKMDGSDDTDISNAVNGSPLSSPGTATEVVGDVSVHGFAGTSLHLCLPMQVG